MEKKEVIERKNEKKKETKKQTNVIREKKRDAEKES